MCVSGIEHFQTIIKNAHKSVRKRQLKVFKGQKTWRGTSQREYLNGQQVNEKKFSTSFVIREITTRLHFTPIGMDKTDWQSQVLTRMESNWKAQIPWEELQECTTTVREDLVGFWKTKHTSTLYPSNSTSRYTQEKRNLPAKIWMQMFK